MVSLCDLFRDFSSMDYLQVERNCLNWRTRFVWIILFIKIIELYEEAWVFKTIFFAFYGMIGKASKFSKYWIFLNLEQCLSLRGTECERINVKIHGVPSNNLFFYKNNNFFLVYFLCSWFTELVHWVSERPGPASWIFR